MILYHGTNIDFNEVQLDKSRVGKDFGFGFYLTPDKQVAARQAACKFRQYGEGEELVHRCYIDELNLQDLKVLRFDERC